MGIAASLAWLPVLIALALALHAALAAAVKGVMSASRPLTGSEPTTATYERRVHSTADPAMLQVVGAAAAAGLVAWLGVVVDSGWFWLLGLLVLGGAVALDLLRWERVATSPVALYVQRGLAGEPRRIRFEDVLDLRIEESDSRVFTLRGGLNNQVARLWLRLPDQKALALPLTDADRGLDGVEAVANQIRSRKAQMDSRHDMARAEAEAERAAREAALAGPSADAEQRLALQRLRQKALAPDALEARPAAKPSGAGSGSGSPSGAAPGAGMGPDAGLRSR
jgi:hypothetical protein